MLPLVVLMPVVSIEPFCLAPSVIPGLSMPDCRGRSLVLSEGRVAHEGKSGDCDKPFS
jgi:hypothetical protein